MEEAILDNEFDEQGNLSTVRYAGFGVRLGAAIIDALAFTPLIILSIYNSFSMKSLPIAFLVIIASTLYKPLMEAQFGATLGKMALKIKVISSNFEKIDLTQAVTRYVPWMVSAAGSFLTAWRTYTNPTFLNAEDMMDLQAFNETQGIDWLQLLGFIILLVSALLMLSNDQKRAGHDKLADTYCIYK